MTYKEETYVLNTLKELKAFIRSPVIEQLITETHENNLMLKSIIKYINTNAALADKENENDFARNVLANLISNNLNINKLGKR